MSLSGSVAYGSDVSDAVSPRSPSRWRPIGPSGYRTSADDDDAGNRRPRRAPASATHARSDARVRAATLIRRSRPPCLVGDERANLVQAALPV